VYNEIREPSLQRMRNFVGTPSMLTAVVVYTITAMSAYFTFGSFISSDLILSYPVNDIAVIIASFAVVLITTASSPLQIHPARQAFTTLVFYICGLVAARRGGQAGSEGKRADPHAWMGGRFPVVVYWTATFALLISIFITAMLVTDLGTLFAIIGAVASTGLMYYIPGFAFFKLFAEDAAARKQAKTESMDMEIARPASYAAETSMFTAKWLTIHRCLAMIMGVVGVLTAVIALVDIAMPSGSVSGPSA